MAHSFIAVAASVDPEISGDYEVPVTIRYQAPGSWIQYDERALLEALTEAKASVLSLTAIPYQREWVEALQEMQLKREVAGTSRIEGAEFTERELEAALAETPAELHTRSQRQAHAAVQTYRWIARLPDDHSIDADLIRAVHRRVVEGCDDDHCPPGRLRERDQNVVFGLPRHRGAEGGDECTQAFAGLTHAVQHEFRGHDRLIQALALHYHVAAMHPFVDGNGRTARALEALALQRAGLRDSLFIAMSNYYYDEKSSYLATLAAVREREHDLTPFLIFGLKGIAVQCTRLLSEIRTQVAKALFRNLMYDLFGRLQTAKKRVIAERQIEILKRLLRTDSLPVDELVRGVLPRYGRLKSPQKAIIRDVNSLIHLGAIAAERRNDNRFHLCIRLEWPTQMTETEFFRRVRQLPQAKTHAFLRWP